ncbi:hypothetical protein NL676_009651 [Syzygium grande]|nr:hypothetical protein NL676_009651 [Syzygium grande]
MTRETRGLGCFAVILGSAMSGMLWCKSKIVGAVALLEGHLKEPKEQLDRETYAQARGGWLLVDGFARLLHRWTVNRNVVKVNVKHAVADQNNLPSWKEWRSAGEGWR